MPRSSGCASVARSAERSAGIWLMDISGFSIMYLKIPDWSWSPPAKTFPWRAPSLSWRGLRLIFSPLNSSSACLYICPDRKVNSLVASSNPLWNSVANPWDPDVVLSRTLLMVSNSFSRTVRSSLLACLTILSGSVMLWASLDAMFSAVSEIAFLAWSKDISPIWCCFRILLA